MMNLPVADNPRQEIERLQARINELEQTNQELRLVKDRLQLNEDLLQIILTNSPNVILIKDVNRRYTRINRRFEELLGLEPGWIHGKTDYDVFPTPVADNCLANDQKVLETGQSLTYEMELPQADGPHTYFENKFPLYDHTGAIYGIGAISTDVTELKKLHEAITKKEIELRQVQKMEAIGRLAGGIAHDFNNQMAAILGYTEFLLARHPAQTPDGTEANTDEEIERQDLLEIRQTVERSVGLTRQLLAFSRKQVLHTEKLNIAETVNNLTSMLRRLIREDIVLTTRIDPEPALVQADPSQIEQILVNLVLNARDALPTGGEVEIAVSRVQVNQADTDNYPYNVKPGPYICLMVKDNGSGMEGETLSHIFEPFYTTKPNHEGTGLGLATIYGIVKQSEGFITVESAVGAGATFMVYLPQLPVAEEADSTEAAPDQPQSGPTESGTEAPAQVPVAPAPKTILVVEDEDSIRLMFARVLKIQKLNVLVAAEGTEAVSIAKTYPGKIDLIVTDIVLPGMRGPEVVKAVRQQHPGLKAILMSGYSEEAVTLQGHMLEDALFLEKPFDLTTFVSKVQQVLEKV